MAKKPRLPDQSKAFIEKAHEIGADENTSAADELMGRLARTPPQPKPQRDISTKKEKAG